MIKISDNELEAESWNDIQNHLFKVYEKDIDRYRSRLVYRGVPDKKFGLETSLQRIGRKPSDVENHLVRNFQKYSPINTLVDNYNNIWNWISLGQHPGLPTRFLDWTFSPNVALHFMTDDISTFNKDGAIWMVDFDKIKKDLPRDLQIKLKQQNTFAFTSIELEKYIGNSLKAINDYEKKTWRCFAIL